MTTDDLLQQKKAIESELIDRIEEELEKIDSRRAALLAIKPPAKPEKKKRGKSTLPPKYRNPDDPTQTWTGRGKPPAWIDVVGREACLIAVEG